MQIPGNFLHSVNTAANYKPQSSTNNSTESLCDEGSPAPHVQESLSKKTPSSAGIQSALQSDLDFQPMFSELLLNLTPPNETTLTKLFEEAEEESILQNIMKDFNNRIRMYPSFLCPICHRLLYHYKNTVKKHSFSVDNIDNMEKIGCSDFTANEALLICLRCHSALKTNKIPAMAYLQVETRLIAQVKPFLKIFHLCKGQGQHALRGSCIHFPQSVDEVIQHLPITKQSADLIIVNQTNEKAGNQLRFQVRPPLIYAALTTLKQINEQYKNITIQHIDTEDLQPMEITQTVENQQYNSTSAPALGYKKISEATNILRASISLSSEIFQAKTSSAAMAAVVIAYSHVQQINTWTSSDLDTIIISGHQFYSRFVATPGDEVEICLLNATVKCFGERPVQIEIINHPLSGYLKKVPGAQLQRLTDSLLTFLAETTKYGILQVHKIYMALVKMDDMMFLFDAVARGPKGKKAKNGFACVLSCKIDVASAYFAEHVHRNCNPQFNYYAKLSDDKKSEFQYYLHLVNITSKKGSQEAAAVNSSKITERQLLEGFLEIDSFTFILRATFHQGTIYYFPNGGTQCGGMAGAACHTLLKSIDEWSTVYLNDVLLCGDRFYQQILNRLPPRDDMYLEANEVQGEIECAQNSKIYIRPSAAWYHGFFDSVPEDTNSNQRLTRLEDSLLEFFQSDYNSAIFTASGYCVGIHKRTTSLYIFDSHSRGTTGQPSEAGTSCVIRFSSEEAHLQASKHLHACYQPAETYTTNADFLVNARWTYTIRPMLCRIVKPPNTDIQSEDEIETDN